MKRHIETAVRIGILATVLLLFLTGACLSGQVQENGENMEVAEQLHADILNYYEQARILTNGGNDTLFLPEGRVGDADTASKLYRRSNAILADFLEKWGELYAEDPSLFTMMDLLRVWNAKGLAFAALAKSDTAEHVQKRYETIELADKALNAIATSAIDYPQLGDLKLSLQRELSGAHIFLYLHYRAANNVAKARKHLELAKQAAPDEEARAEIDKMLDSK